MTLIKFKRSEHKNPETEIVARLIDRAESEGSVSSPSPEIWTKPVMINGFLCRVEKFDDKWQGLAYKQVPDRKNGGWMDVNIDKLPLCPTREDAERILYTVVRSM